MPIKIYAKLGSLPQNVFWVKWRRKPPAQGEYIRIREIYPLSGGRFRPWKEVRVESVEQGLYKLDLI